MELLAGRHAHDGRWVENPATRLVEESVRLRGGEEGLLPAPAIALSASYVRRLGVTRAGPDPQRQLLHGLEASVARVAHGIKLDDSDGREP